MLSLFFYRSTMSITFYFPSWSRRKTDCFFSKLIKKNTKKNKKKRINNVIIVFFLSFDVVD